MAGTGRNMEASDKSLVQAVSALGGAGSDTGGVV
jgi:hypothetical protein